jgi:hypothetical protein
MAIELSREGWLQLFTQRRSPSGFLQRMFTIKPGGIYNGKKVAIDIQRFGEQVAIVVKQGTGPRLNDHDIFTTKEFTPPAYGEAVPFDVNDLLERMAGVDPFTAAYTDFAGQLISYLLTGFSLINDKIIRGVELQASQILQTGILDLKDEAGNTLYTLDFSPKATHFPTTGTSWSTVATADPVGDLESLADVVSSDGKVTPNEVVMGRTALKNFLANADVQLKLDNRRMTLGQIAPQFVGSGATFYGFVWAGTYELAIFAYPAEYEDPQTGNPTKYVADDKVIMTSTETRLDMTSAKVPLPLGPDPRVAGLLPGRLTDESAGFDVTPNVYCTPNGKQIMGELESRPLLIPVQIDGFGCLDTEI